jgi:hypothetical protein
LINFLSFENAKPHLKEDYVKEVEAGTKQWEQHTTVEKAAEEFLDYMKFAWGKAEDERGISASRSVQKLGMWLWIMNRDDLRRVIEDDDLYDRLRRTAAADPNSDARPQIIAWMQEQADEKYRRALDKIDNGADDSEEGQEKVKQDNKSDSSEPAKVKPKKKQPAPPPAGNAGGLPPLPPLPGGDSGGLPPLPPLPPLKEGDDVLASLVKMLGR